MSPSNCKTATLLRGGLIVCLAILSWQLAARGPAVALQTAPAPTADPLAVPTLPPNPTQVDRGRVSYYYNCMPCHGDRGQGLTEAWRQTWVEDHRNCWDRGCHAGRAGDEGFPLPRIIPAVAGPSAALARFTSPVTLHDYLQQTHPPQRPGVLPQEEYWALTAFLLAENDQPLPAQDLGATSPSPALGRPALAVLAGLAVFWLWRRRARAATKEQGSHDQPH